MTSLANISVIFVWSGPHVANGTWPEHALNQSSKSDVFKVLTFELLHMICHCPKTFRQLIHALLEHRGTQQTPSHFLFDVYD